MRRLFVVGVSSLSILFIVFACTNNAGISEFKQIDSIVQILQKAELKLQEINRDTVEKKYKLFQEYFTKIDQNMYQSKTNDEAWNTICAYGHMKKPLRNMYNNYMDFLNSLDSAKIRLENLKYDVRKELIDKNKFQKYYQSEKKEATLILNKITGKVELAKKELANFDTVHPKLVKLINKSFKKKQP